MGRFAKFVRPETPSPGVTTERDLDIIEAILRYRFSPTSQLVRLVGGNEDVTLRRLRRLWEKGLVNRLAFPGIRTHSEFHYYLDCRDPVDLLIAHGRITEPHPAMLEEIRSNREKNYADAAVRGQHMQLGFLQHSLMISRMHFMLEMACRRSSGSVKLEAWSQGGPLAGNKVQVPKIKSSRQGNDYFWQESDETERLPVEPDALFTLGFAAGKQGPPWQAHFFYEADRGTMNTTDMLKKLRAYYHFIKKQQRHREAFGIHPIRAVLVETTNETRARRLMGLVHHPLLCGRGKRGGLFWFTISPLFADPKLEHIPSKRPLPHYLESPETLFSPIWALPDGGLHSLSDMENSST
jgi:protein involved in plasmid replication-relaxation